MLKRMTLVLTVSLATAALFGCGDEHPGRKAKHEAQPAAAESESAAASADDAPKPADVTADAASAPAATDVGATSATDAPTFGPARPNSGQDPAGDAELQHMRDVRAQQAQAVFNQQQEQAVAKAAAAAPQHPTAKKGH